MKCCVIIAKKHKGLKRCEDFIYGNDNLYSIH